MGKIVVRFPEAWFEYATELSSLHTVQDLWNHLLESNMLSQDAEENFYFTNNGLCINRFDNLEENSTYFLKCKLLGGKGGFGSMLRALGSQIEKTTNNEACRDLSGRRMRDINNEKKLMEWVKEKAEKDRQKEREKIEKLEKQLQKPKHFFNGPTYEKSLEETTESVEDALKTGLKATKRISSGASTTTSEPLMKKTKLWLGADDISDSSDCDSDTEIPMIHHQQPEPSKDGGQSSKSTVNDLKVP